MIVLTLAFDYGMIMMMLMLMFVLFSCYVRFFLCLVFL